MDDKIKLLSQRLLYAEGIVLALILLAYWYPSPIRDEWIWVIGLLVPFIFIRLALHRRLWVSTPFEELIVAFVGLTIINILATPYETRGVILLFRPLLGFALFIYCVEYAHICKSLRLPLLITLSAGFILGVLGLTAINEWSGKSDMFTVIIDALPRFQNIPILMGGFNPNEIAGAMVWFAPLAIAVAFHKGFSRGMRAIAGGAAFLLISAIILGQSLSGAAGLALGLVIVLTPRHVWRYTAAAGLVAILILQAAVMLAPMRLAEFAADVVGRDNTVSLQHRGELWTSAVDMFADYPLTGVGIANYRSPPIRDLYPTPNFSPFDAVHPHNELLQYATDYGIPGIVIFAGFYVVAAYLLLKVDRHGDAKARALVVGLAAGLLAHMAYGLGDAIPVWDRFAFLFWWLLGFVAALYVVTKPQEAAVESM